MHASARYYQRFALAASITTALLFGCTNIDERVVTNRQSAEPEGTRRKRRDDGAPKVGEVAPVFALKTLDGEREVNLAGFKGKRPVILFFGSYT